jgi:hypothetical protein
VEAARFDLACATTSGRVTLIWAAGSVTLAVQSPSAQGTVATRGAKDETAQLLEAPAGARAHSRAGVLGYMAVCCILNQIIGLYLESTLLSSRRFGKSHPPPSPIKWSSP